VYPAQIGIWLVASAAFFAIAAATTGTLLIAATRQGTERT
jgi:hypothetical protein